MKDVVHSFWNKYQKADCLKREKIIKKMGCFKRMYPLFESKQLSNAHKEIIFNHMLQSYFDDIMDVMGK